MITHQTAPSLCFTSARELARMIATRQVSAREVMAAHLTHINRLNPTLNAIVARLDDDRCLALADEADRRLASGAETGPLHGLPIAFKDLEAAVGFPWTRGSPIFAHDMPVDDTVLVERLRRAGTIPIGKTNVPELGMGSHTYNKVYGTTLNPYDQTKSAGGSSGGAAAAVATGMLPCADGSDLGGSLRNPGSFNNVVGFRPSFGLVASAPTPLPFVSFAVKGPIARTVDDAAFLLSAIAGTDPRDPVSYPSDPSSFAAPLDRDFEGVRIAWGPDLGGLPLDRRVRAVVDRQRRTFADLGCIVEERSPGLEAADKIFLDIRAWMTSYNHGALLDAHRDQLKPEAIWEIEKGRRLSAHDVAATLAQHAELLQRWRLFQQDYEFFVCTVNQVPPFDANETWPKEIDSLRMEHYIAWMKSTYWVSATLCPALSVPAGFTDDGLPVGIQIVGRRHDDFGVLQLGHAFEQATGFGRQRPAIVSSLG
jgi:amidase